MKRRSAWSIGIVGILFATATLVSAANMDDIVGTWGVFSKATAKVSKLGTDHSEGYGAIEFTDSGFFAYDDPGGYTYTGTFTLSADGKMLTMQLDDAGRQEFEGMLTDWLQRAAGGKGLSLKNIDFQYDAKGIFVSPVKTSKKTKGPTKGKVSAKGIVYADVWQGTVYIGPESGKFSFTSTTQFLSKH
jgi:hypothetical protein